VPRAFILLLLCVVARALPAQERAPGELVVRGLSFEGNRAIDDYTLKASIATSESSAWQRYWWLRAPFGLFGFGEKRYFDETEFRRDVLRVELLYRQTGFFEAELDTLLRRTSEDVWITIRVREGSPVRVVAVDVQGTEGIAATRELIRDLPLRVGDPFNRFLLQASADTIRAMLANRGYPFVEIYQGFDENRPAHEARVEFTVDPGPRARVDGILVEGIDEVNPGVVRRSLGVRVGDWFRRQSLLESQRELYQTGLFSSASVTVVDSTPEEAADSLVTVRARVTETQLRRVRAGAGYGALDCFRGLANWTGRDFLGGGRTLEITGQVSKIAAHQLCVGDETDSTRLDLNYHVAAAFQEPFLFNRRTGAALSVFAERRSELNTFVRTAQGGEASLTRQLGWRMPLTLSYSLVFGRTVADQAIFCSLLNLCRLEDSLFNARTRESTLSLGFSLDRANSPLNPSRGVTLTAQARYASSLIGADSLGQFAKALLNFSSYHQVGRQAVFAWRVRAGAIIPAEIGFQTRRAEFAPPSERLYAGGPNTVRGFGQNEMGPLVRVLERIDFDTTVSDQGTVVRPDSLIRTSATGGNQLFVANLELRAPLPLFAGRVNFALFVDAGGVWTSEAGLTGSPGFRPGLRVTPGTGLRIVTPLGPIRLDVAYNGYDPTPGPLYRVVGGALVVVNPAYVPAGSRFKFHFSVGQAF